MARGSLIATPARMSVAVFGSRDYPDANRRVYARLRMLQRDWPNIHFCIVSGGARGVDKAAERAARKLHMSLAVHLADWDKFGKQAGFIRNELIVRDADRGICFWDLESRGTADTIRRFLMHKKHLEIWDAECEPAGNRAADIAQEMGRG